jgi:hypothetical protein
MINEIKKLISFIICIVNQLQTVNKVQRTFDLTHK